MGKEKTKDIFTVEEVNTFISFLDDDIDKNIAKLIFIDKLTNEQIADIIGYSKRHIERRRFNLFVTVVKKLIKLHTVNTEQTCTIDDYPNAWDPGGTI